VDWCVIFLVKKDIYQESCIQATSFVTLHEAQDILVPWPEGKKMHLVPNPGWNVAFCGRNMMHELKNL